MNLNHQQILCENCDQPIPSKRLELVPSARLCVQCKSNDDDFKWRMKTVGFNEEPTIAKDKKSWDILRKQKQSRDI